MDAFAKLLNVPFIALNWKYVEIAYKNEICPARSGP